MSTGPVLNSSGPNQELTHQIVETATEARAAVQAQYDFGFRTVKLYSNLRREPYEAILQKAFQLGMAVVGHTPEGVRSEGIPETKPFDISFAEILNNGFVAIEHIEAITWHGLRDQLDESKMRILAIQIAQSGTAVTPTLIAHDNLVRVAASKGAYLLRPGTETINPLLKRFVVSQYEYWSGQDPKTREAEHGAFYRTATGILHEAGVPLVAGTDAGIFTNIPGSSMTRELELLVASGLSPYEALQAATVVAGPVLGLADRGQVAPGFRANLILWTGDPLADISDAEHPHAVVLGGVWLDRSKLAELKRGAAQTSQMRSARRLLRLLLWF